MRAYGQNALASPGGATLNEHIRAFCNALEEEEEEEEEKEEEEEEEEEAEEEEEEEEEDRGRNGGRSEVLCGSNIF